MGFVLSDIQLKRVRNHTLCDFEPDEHITIIVGKNGAGKTNIIEVIQTLCTSDSFRHPTWDEMILWNEQEAVATLKAIDTIATRELDISLSITEDNHQFCINGKPAAAKQLIGEIPCVLFTPDDLRAIKDGAERRRNLIDAVGVQISKTYGSIKHDYEKVIKQRNSLLKDRHVPEELLDSWTTSLLELGVLFYEQRSGLFERLKAFFLPVLNGFIETKENNVSYIASWDMKNIEGLDDRDKFQRALNECAAEERDRGVSLIGPHRDELFFSLGGRDARKFGSQGQQRAIILAWKLAEVKVMESMLGTKPVLLLDDVMSELDDQRRRALINFIHEEDIQTLITTTSLDYFDEAELQAATVIEL